MTDIIGAFLPIIGLLIEWGMTIFLIAVVFTYIVYGICYILYGIVCAIKSAYRYAIGEFKYLRKLL